LRAVFTLLLNDQSLPARFRDHPLRSEWADHRDCHLRPDLILIFTVSRMPTG
jgi:mRNA interferase YafQ